ncbi:MAG: hypothetical protein U0271_07470 [Polyangiaceae bacterium]
MRHFLLLIAGGSALLGCNLLLEGQDYHASVGAGGQAGHGAAPTGGSGAGGDLVGGAGGGLVGGQGGTASCRTTDEDACVLPTGELTFPFDSSCENGGFCEHDTPATTTVTTSSGYLHIQTTGPTGFWDTNVEYPTMLYRVAAEVRDFVVVTQVHSVIPEPINANFAVAGIFLREPNGSWMTDGSDEEWVKFEVGYLGLGSQVTTMGPGLLLGRDRNNVSAAQLAYVPFDQTTWSTETLDIELGICRIGPSYVFAWRRDGGNGNDLGTNGLWTPVGLPVPQELPVFAGDLQIGVGAAVFNPANHVTAEFGWLVYRFGDDFISDDCMTEFASITDAQAPP